LIYTWDAAALLILVGRKREKGCLLAVLGTITGVTGERLGLLIAL
jgi:hypothetical protein